MNKPVKQLVNYESIIHIFLICLQILCYHGFQLFTIYPNYFVIFYEVLLGFAIIFSVISAYFLYKFVSEKKLMHICLFLQSMGIVLSMFMYREHLIQLVEIKPNKFILYAYLLFTLMALIVYATGWAIKQTTIRNDVKKLVIYEGAINIFLICLHILAKHGLHIRVFFLNWFSIFANILLGLGIVFSLLTAYFLIQIILNKKWIVFCLFLQAAGMVASAFAYRAYIIELERAVPLKLILIPYLLLTALALAIYAPILIKKRVESQV